MVNIADVLSVVFSINLKLKDWEEKAPDGLREMFEEVGHVSPKRQPPAGQTSGQKPPEWDADRDGVKHDETTWPHVLNHRPYGAVSPSILLTRPYEFYSDRYFDKPCALYVA